MIKIASWPLVWFWETNHKFYLYMLTLLLRNFERFKQSSRLLVLPSLVNMTFHVFLPKYRLRFRYVFVPFRCTDKEWSEPLLIFSFSTPRSPVYTNVLKYRVLSLSMVKSYHRVLVELKVLPFEQVLDIVVTNSRFNPLDLSLQLKASTTTIEFPMW